MHAGAAATRWKRLERLCVLAMASPVISMTALALLSVFADVRDTPLVPVVGGHFLLVLLGFPLIVNAYMYAKRRIRQEEETRGPEEASREPEASTSRPIEPR